MTYIVVIPVKPLDSYLSNICAFAIWTLHLSCISPEAVKVYIYIYCVALSTITAVGVLINCSAYFKGLLVPCILGINL